MQQIHIFSERFRIDELIGSGGMAEVFLGHDLMLERPVAIKVLRKKYSDDPEFRERFRQEAKAAANLSHTNIVTVYDFGLDGEDLYIIMEYVPGRDLNTIIKENGQLGTNEGIYLIIQACKAIGYAHRSGLVHCDVKPHNFLVTEDLKLKVTDFGIARAMASINRDEESDIVWGSPQYFSPEQAGGYPPSPASDVYSIGVVMYYLFTGQLPFSGKNANELARMHRRDEPIPPMHINPVIPSTLNDIILKVLSKEPSARYRMADQLGRVLQTFQKQFQEVADAQPEPPTKLPPNMIHNENISESSGNSKSRSKEVQQSSINLQQEFAADSNVKQMKKRSASFDPLNTILFLFSLVFAGGLVPFFLWIFLSISKR
ncbi:MAG: serine/threonine protein kinase [Anaerolineales bacterium]|nr:serine/threonine protein kinase [Anaerolineales bacterium]